MISSKFKFKIRCKKTNIWAFISFKRWKNEWETDFVNPAVMLVQVWLTEQHFVSSFSRRQTHRAFFLLMQCHYCLQRKRKASRVHRHSADRSMEGPIVGSWERRAERLVLPPSWEEEHFSASRAWAKGGWLERSWGGFTTIVNSFIARDYLRYDWTTAELGQV